MAMLFKNPATMYAGCAGIMFLIYTGVEFSHSKLSDSGTKFVMSSWCFISLITMSIIMSIWSSYQVGVADTQTIGIAVLLFILTLCVSCSVLYSAF